jgi:hypothetical protein
MLEHTDERVVLLQQEGVAHWAQLRGDRRRGRAGQPVQQTAELGLHVRAARAGQPAARAL